MGIDNKYLTRYDTILGVNSLWKVSVRYFYYSHRQVLFFSYYSRNIYSKRRDKFVKHLIEGTTTTRPLASCKCIWSDEYLYLWYSCCIHVFLGYLSASWRLTGEWPRDRNISIAPPNAFHFSLSLSYYYMYCIWPSDSFAQPICKSTAECQLKPMRKTIDNNRNKNYIFLFWFSSSSLK